MKERLTIKNCWKVIPGALTKHVWLVTPKGPIQGRFETVVGIGVDFIGDREYDPLEPIEKLMFQRRMDSPMLTA